MKNIITIAGRPGSGKSSTAKLVAEKLGYKHFSSGDLFRQIASEMDKDVLEANKDAEGDQLTEIDKRVDQKLREIGEQETEIVIDSRTAWHWIPDSFKIFLDLDLETAAERILAQLTPERIAAEHIPSSPAAYAEQLGGRLESEKKRYKKFYDIDPTDHSNYDLVVDTKTNNLEQVVEIILDSFNKR